MRTSLKRSDAIAFRGEKSSDIRRRGIGRMTYARQEEVLEEERREIGASRKTGLPVNRERLLADCPLACLAQVSDFLMPETLELEQRDVAFSRRQAPLVELGVDGYAQALEHVLRLAAPALRVSARLGQLTAELLGSRSRRCELPRLNADAREGGGEDKHLEGLRGEAAGVGIDDGIDSHEHGDEREH